MVSVPLLRSLAVAVALIHTSLAAASASKLPVVDLGYELQRATLYNNTGGYYNFSNIRYAAPPTGNLRFRAPRPPKKNRGTVQTGLPDRICAQAGPAWYIIAEQFVPEYLQGQTVFNESSFNTTTGPPAPLDPRTTEDCLFLDVLVPKNIFDNAGKGKGAPVLVWIYGGGYTEGSKSGSGNPAGLLAASGGTKGDKVIYVSMNYRLGAFGWLSGPTFQADGTANAGLYDQRFALEWVQKHISKFGGDPDRVTVFGESAGGGSIMHQITAYGHLDGGVPFQQAIPQSPGFIPIVSNQQQEQTLDNFLSLLGVSTIEEARQKPYSALVQANAQQVGAAVYGQFVYGPTVDGKFVPALPGELLLHGQYPKDLKIMVGHNADEVCIMSFWL
jgi:carboxylesterase type B